MTSSSSPIPIALTERFQDGHLVLSACLSLAAVGCIISSLEWLSLWRHFTAGGLFSWEASAARSRIRSPRWRAVQDAINRHPNFLFLLALRGAAALVIVLQPADPRLVCLCCTIIALISNLLAMRESLGFTGADHMSKMIFVTGAICVAAPSPWIWQCGLVFICAQLLLAYGTSGWIRIFEKSWRDGSALLVVLRQRTYGRRLVWRLAQGHPRALRVVSLGVLLFECLFPLALVAPEPVMAAMFAFGVAFHVGNAVILGLNNFIWAFGAAYPAAWWVWHQLH